MKKAKSLQLNRETLRNLSQDSLTKVEGGTLVTWGCSAAPGCAGTNNCTTGSAGCHEN